MFDCGEDSHALRRPPGGFLSDIIYHRCFAFAIPCTHFPACVCKEFAAAVAWLFLLLQEGGAFVSVCWRLREFITSAHRLGEIWKKR